MRLGLVGCGWIGRSIALLTRFTPGVQITACCDRDLEEAQRVARRYGIPAAYQDYTRLIEEQELDAVYLALPHDLHAPYTLQAIERRIPVWLEKPLARNLEEGLQIVRAGEAAGVKVGVNYQYRYEPAAYRLAMGVRSGALGRISYAVCQVPWDRRAAYHESAPWRASQQRAGGGTLLTQGSHVLDLVLWMLGSAPQQARAWTGNRIFHHSQVEDLAMGVLELADGTPVQFTSSMVSRPEQPLRITIYGENGSASYIDRRWQSLEVRGFRLPPARLATPGMLSFQRSLIGFRDWIEKDIPYAIPARESLPVLQAIDAVYAAAASGTAISCSPYTLPTEDHNP